tara:strand:+ start:64 stop:1359 length:1296 start_codon:yes stop_codon:yes gene_type:complete
MSSNLDISGILATLLNSDAESPQSTTSVRNLDPVSLSTALNRSHVREQDSKNAQSQNQTKKAIVLQAVIGTPTMEQPQESTNWMEAAKAILLGFGATKVQTDVMVATFVTNYPEYYVWVLPSSTENVSSIPAFQGTSNVANAERFTKCVIDDASIGAAANPIIPGACVRIDYENRKLRTGAYVVSIINNTPEFANAVIEALDGVASAGGGFAPCNEQGVSVRHPSGDPLGTNASGGGTPHFEPVIPVGEPSQWPTVGVFTSRFQTSRPPVAGATKKAAAHPGIDIGAPLGTAVYPAIGHGKVVSMNQRSAAGNPCQNGAGQCNVSGDGRGFGNWVRIKHTIGGKTLITQYNHLQLVTVKIGDTVGMTTKIAETGHTGTGTGPHLHWELWNPSWASRRYNPSAPGSTHVDPIQGLRLQLASGDRPPVAPNAT